jgi:hypothetical protein
LTDIFREIEEDVRRERFQKFWNAYRGWLIGAIVLLLAGVAAWQVWQRYDRGRRDEAALAFAAAQRISAPAPAASAFADFAKSAPRGYAAVARLSEAGAMVASGQRADAIALFKDIAAKNDGPVGAVARLRAAWAMADTASRTELQTLLAPLDDPGSAWRENAREVLAYADFRALDLKASLAKYQALANDGEAPDALRARANAMVEFLQNGGAKSYGTVPASKPAEAPAAPAPGSSPVPMGAATAQ